jgi:hypothetical protein
MQAQSRKGPGLEALNGGKDDRLFDVTAFETRTNDPREGMRHEPLEGVIVLPNHLLGSANDDDLELGVTEQPGHDPACDDP